MLVITIIVLLILVEVAIQTLRKSGIINYTIEAKGEWNLSQQKEKGIFDDIDFTIAKETLRRR